MNGTDHVGGDFPDQDALLQALAQRFGMDVIDVSEVPIPGDTIGIISAEVAWRYCVLPVKRDGEVLTVAISDPMALDTLDSLRHMLKIPVEAVYCPRMKLRKAMERYYGDSGT